MPLFIYPEKKLSSFLCELFFAISVFFTLLIASSAFAITGLNEPSSKTATEGSGSNMESLLATNDFTIIKEMLAKIALSESQLSFLMAELKKQSDIAKCGTSQADEAICPDLKRTIDKIAEEQAKWSKKSSAIDKVKKAGGSGVSNPILKLIKDYNNGNVSDFSSSLSELWQNMDNTDFINALENSGITKEDIMEVIKTGDASSVVNVAKKTLKNLGVDVDLSKDVIDKIGIGGEFSSIVDALCRVTSATQAGPVKALLVMIVLFMGAGAFFGKVSWAIVVLTTSGIASSLGAGAIAEIITGAECLVNLSVLDEVENITNPQ